MGRSVLQVEIKKQHPFDMPEEEAVQASLHLSQRAFESADCREGVRAFFAKERPRFTHR